MNQRSPLNIRVVIKTEGDSYQRDYVRGEEHIGYQRFVERSVGNLLLLVGHVSVDDERYEMPNITEIRYFEIDYDTVVENRKYHHTTH